ncbi:hypothetical protein H112_04376 [Trichophyton rubrum D6]|uniref:Uncharacterized protein n=3 Tax=Trichophyton TaxID=5550 RepID=A0A080WTJ5_TRIRC|nr:uncharacterized protein TERG_04147 [Trichophyton rubrum CBS 118892]EZF22890.1 hypothetical protein H100_04385 [Trichophyton rubrum MR850]EZF41893.1 hypothetical protein H102_04369 [Trichophyton rubrum CBS 100081]EZF52501.1 hypothetical protein H103_04378 [Trichophyton rubrum CBS 288.86]EZF63169.1 hypothetical protein H104_04367 [Trichophyton rubrum CBS 289.86]EZF73742.1 hypothetical protein H105_04393 [Trichophyton soudanense CBS 452.61]EZF84474.1 hypothetical protein H110_04371 [Trichophy
MSRVIGRPKRTSAEVAQILQTAVKNGLDRKQADRILSKAKMSDYLMKIYDHLDALKNPYLTPETNLPGIKINMGVKPRFFEQTSERELKEKYNLPTFQLDPHTKESPIPPNNSDSSYGLWLDLQEVFSKVGLLAEKSLARQRGLEILENRHGDNPMMIEFTGSPTRTHDYQWCTKMIYKYKDFPHLMVKSLHKITRDGTENCILRSELMILVRLIVLKARKDENEPHEIFPVRHTCVYLTPQLPFTNIFQ